MLPSQLVAKIAYKMFGDNDTPSMLEDTGLDDIITDRIGAAMAGAFECAADSFGGEFQTSVYTGTEVADILRGVAANVRADTQRGI